MLGGLAATAVRGPSGDAPLSAEISDVVSASRARRRRSMPTDDSFSDAAVGGTVNCEPVAGNDDVVGGVVAAVWVRSKVSDTADNVALALTISIVGGILRTGTDGASMVGGILRAEPRER